MIIVLGLCMGVVINSLVYVFFYYLNSKEEEKIEKKGTPILSPMVGTFYNSPAPNEKPFVEVGDTVATGQVICIIEAMKLMNEIEAEISGRIVEICVEDGQPVEFGQVLMYVE